VHLVHVAREAAGFTGHAGLDRARELLSIMRAVAHPIDAPPRLDPRFG
jgi:hypothetical protein